MSRQRVCTILTTLAVTFTVVGCSFRILSPAIQGSGVSKTEKRDVGNFGRIDASGAVQLEYTAGPAAPVEVTTDDNLLPLLITTVEGDTLKVYMKSNTSTKVGTKVKVSAPSLKQLTLSGACTGTLHGLDSKALKLDANGASHITATGKADRLEIDASGASGIDTRDLTARSVHVSASGASTANVRADQELNANASGASTVHYKGSPSKVEQDSSGASHISKD